jgi:hypothetical protein
MRSSVEISIHKQMSSAQNELFQEVHHVELCQGEQCKIFIMLGFATGPTLQRGA